eukprot:3202133-Prymnesium_polylepis.2
MACPSPHVGTPPSPKTAHLFEVLEHAAEVGVDLANGRGEGAPLVAADLDLLELLELHHRLAHVEQIVAALEERIEPREEGRVLDAPRVVGHLVVGARLVVKVD